jgi:uncharacterized integral membrane protein
MLRNLWQREHVNWVAVLVRAIELVLFALIAVVGLFPQVFNRFGLTALTVAGIVLTLIVVGGIALMWIYLIAGVDASELAVAADKPL